jgi:hypothetical protein
MSAACSTAISWETLVDYWARDLGGTALEQLEEHLLGCSECTARSARVAAITERIRSLIPPVVDRATVARLRARGLRILENPVARGERKACVFPHDVDILLHRLGGLMLEDATGVTVRVLVESTDVVLMDLPEAPFDPDSGEILIACQQHFSVFPSEVLFEVFIRATSGAEELVRFAVPHHFLDA